MSPGRCSFASCNGANCSRIWIELSWSLKDCFKSCSHGIPAHCSLIFSILISLAIFLASLAMGENALADSLVFCPKFVLVYLNTFEMPWCPIFLLCPRVYSYSEAGYSHEV